MTLTQLGHSLFC